MGEDCHPKSLIVNKIGKIIYVRNVVCVQINFCGFCFPMPLLLGLKIPKESSFFYIYARYADV